MSQAMAASPALSQVRTTAAQHVSIERSVVKSANQRVGSGVAFHKFGSVGTATCSPLEADSALKGQSINHKTDVVFRKRRISGKGSFREERKVAIAILKQEGEAVKDETLHRRSILRANATALSVAAVSLLSGVGRAAAEGVHVEDLQAAVEQVIDLSKQVADGAGVAYDVAKNVYEQVVEAIQPAVDAAAPVVQQATDATLKAAAPVAESLAEEAVKALQQAGFDAQPALDAAKSAAAVAGDASEQVADAVKAAQPIAESTLDNVLASDPLVLVIGAGALLLLYLLAPAIASTVVNATRGYTGDVTAAQALDLVSSQDFSLVDLRTDKEKGKSGLPSLPKNAKKKMLVVSCEEFTDKKLRGQLRNPKSVEAEVTAIKIASLKKIGKGSRIILLDEFCDVSKQVAKSLSSLGFSNVYVVDGGFSGGSGWLQSRLSTEPYYFGEPVFLSPSRILSGTRSMLRNSNGSSGTGTARRAVDAEVVQRTGAAGRLSLPGGRD